MIAETKNELYCFWQWGIDLSGTARVYKSPSEWKNCVDGMESAKNIYQTRDLWTHPLSPSACWMRIHVPFFFKILNGIPLSTVNRILFLVPGPERMLAVSDLVITVGVLLTRDLCIQPSSASKSRKWYQFPVFSKT